MSERWNDDRLDDLHKLVSVNDDRLDRQREVIERHEQQLTTIASKGDRRAEHRFSILAGLVMVLAGQLGTIITLILTHH